MGKEGLDISIREGKKALKKKGEKQKRRKM